VISVQISISARHGHLSEATREKIQAKLEKLPRLFERLTAIDVRVDLEHEESPSVDIRVSAEHKHDFQATDRSESLMASVDNAVHKLEQQLRKYKEKVQEHHRGPNPRELGSRELDVAGGPESDGQ
jgi:putative sigma-54 modulation protein